MTTSKQLTTATFLTLAMLACLSPPAHAAQCGSTSAGFEGWKQQFAGEARANLQRTHVVGVGPTGFDVETAILVPHPEYNHAFDVRQAILLEIYARLEGEGIALARPPALVGRTPRDAPPPGMRRPASCWS